MATEAAKAGTYGVEEHAIIEKKAATIVDCFINSEVPPRIQVWTINFQKATYVGR